MPYPLPLTRTEAYLAYKAGVIQQSDLKPSLAVPRNGIDAWLAYWTGLAADYPKREDGTPHILQEEAYIAYLCGVINEYPEKCLRRVGAYLRYLISARWGRPDHPLNREELYLSLLKTQVIPSGDPSSDIEINGTAKAAFQDLKMYGDTFQQSYNGTNLYNATPYSSGAQQGITTTITDGYILSYSGTSTTSYANLADWTSGLALPAGTYTFCIDHPISTKMTLRVSFAPTTQDVEIPAGSTSATFTTTAVMASARLFISTGGTGIQLSETGVKINLVAGSTATSSFEPYTGGPSPNPDYPQDIYNVSGQQNVVVTGKNIYRTLYAMIKAKEAGKTINATRCTIVEMDNNKLVTDASGVDAFIGIDNLTTINPNSRDYGIKVEGGQKYTLSYDAGGYTQYIARAFNDSNTQVAEWSNNNTGNAPGHYKYTFTMPASAAWFGIRFDNESTRHSEVRASISNIMMEKGDEESSYEPYIERSNTVELCGKNLFDIDNLIVGYVSNNGSIVEREDTRTCPMFRVTPGKKYIASGQPHGFNVIAFYDYNKNFISRPNSIPAATAPDNAYWGRSTCIGTDINTVQLEEGSVATDYEKHWHIELNKLGDDQDYIYKEDGVWKIHKATSKEYLYNCNYYMNPAGETGRYRVWNDSLREIIKKTVDSYDMTSARCDSYQAKTQAQTYNGQKGFDVNTNGYVQFYDVEYDGSDKKDAFVEMLREKSAFIVFALASASEGIITNQSLIEQLEALVAGGAEEGTTYIKVSATDPNLPAKLYVEAPKYD